MTKCTSILKFLINELLHNDLSHVSSPYNYVDIEVKYQFATRSVSNSYHLCNFYIMNNSQFSVTKVLVFQETTESVTFRMLDNVVALELIQTRLTQQIRPYMKEHHLKEDVVFTKYVKVSLH